MSQSLDQIMTRNVATVSPQQSAAEAAQLMSRHNVGSVPVVQNGQCVGIITDRDISLRLTAKGMDASTTKVETIMSKDMITGTPQMDIHEAATILAQHQIRRLPIIENNHLAGIVSLGDLAVKNVYQNEAGEALSNISKPSEPKI